MNKFPFSLLLLFSFSFQSYGQLQDVIDHINLVDKAIGVPDVIEMNTLKKLAKSQNLIYRTAVIVRDIGVNPELESGGIAKMKNDKREKIKYHARPYWKSGVKDIHFINMILYDKSDVIAIIADDKDYFDKQLEYFRQHCKEITGQYWKDTYSSESKFTSPFYSTFSANPKGEFVRMQDINNIELHSFYLEGETLITAYEAEIKYQNEQIMTVYVFYIEIV